MESSLIKKSNGEKIFTEMLDQQYVDILAKTPDPVVASVALAKRMERCGADALVAEGCEAGGHIGESTTMVLVPQVADAVSIPVIAAGGIADGRGIAAAFMLGAKGIHVEMRMLATMMAQTGIQAATFLAMATTPPPG